jgi:hypothetical protein
MTEEKRNSTKHISGLHASPLWRWIAVVSVVSAIVLLLIAAILTRRAEPILKSRVIETLSTRFGSKVELDDLQVSITHGLSVEGHGLRIFPPDDVMAAGANQPLINIQQFDFRASIIGLFFKPTRVGAVYVHGLSIQIPPREMRQQGASHPRHLGKIKIVVDKIVCKDSQLVIRTAKPNKDPKVFALKHIELRDVGPNTPWPYDAVLTNAIPTGDIQANGSFGPWDTEEPGNSQVNGKYIFDHADLNTIKGIAGTLHSEGSFDGQLDRIAVRGTTEVPNFSLDTANNPMRLETTFSAIVDGTSGDTYLQPVQAKLGASAFTCRGAVVNVKGQGHVIDLDVDVPGGRIEDFLQLAVKTQPPVMSAIVVTKTKLHIRPGKESVSQKMTLQGSFMLQNIHFTNPEVEDKVDMLSLRAQGSPQAAKPGAEDVTSRMSGNFAMGNGELNFSDLNYTLPGANVRLAGIYSLDGNQFEFTGKVRTNAKISQMVASKWKSFMLKLVDPFFKKNGAGAEIPLKISGTKSAPKFGLNLGGK